MLELVGLAFRGGERIIIVIAAFVSIWLGYKLFAIVVSDKSNFEGKIGEWQIKMQRIAPGVFFALFGASVLIFALKAPYNTGTNTSTGQSGVSYNNSMAPIANEQDAQIMLSSLTSLKAIIEKPTTVLAPEDRSFVLQSMPPLDRLRNLLVDRVYGAESVNWYQERYKDYLTAGKSTEKFSPDDAQKFNNIKYYMNAQ